jgi:hypothetical protein
MNITERVGLIRSEKERTERDVSLYLIKLTNHNRGGKDNGNEKLNKNKRL